MERLIYLTNIPTPYRIARFNLMQEVFPKYGIEFEVWYLAESEPNRWWTIDAGASQFAHRTFRGLHPTIGGMFAHINPGLLHSLKSAKYDMLVVGGMGSPSHWLAAFISRRSAVRVLSVESNLQSVSRHTGLAFRLKRLIAGQYIKFQVTGGRSEEYVRSLLPKARRTQFITLPNIVEESRYVTDVRRFRADASALQSVRSQFGNPRQLWLCPARLEEVKGLQEFLPLLVGMNDVHLVVAGEGSLRITLQRLIDQLRLPATLVGGLQPEDLMPLYAAADLFVLPSKKDPSPLTPIEGLAAGLPLLVSQNVGNFADVLTPDNGWAYVPTASTDERRGVLDNIRRTSPYEMRSRGVSSEQLYQKRFDSRTLVDSYGLQLRVALDEAADDAAR